MATIQRAIDLVHLARQTFGNQELEQEVLGLFHDHAQVLLYKLERSFEPNERRNLIHGLRGSALNIGATKIVDATNRLSEVAEADSESWAIDLRFLQDAVAETCKAIAHLRQRH